MKPSIKAALWSAIVLPGLGQLVILKRYKRGAVMAVIALAAISTIGRNLLVASSDLFTQAASGTLAPDPVAIAEELSRRQEGNSNGSAALVLFACWAASIVDALLLKD